MRFQDALAYAVKNLRTRSLRSWLTIIGIVIGVIAMMVITSVTEGVNAQVTALLSTFGPDKMFIIPINIDKGASMSFGGGASQTPFGKLYQKDVDAVRSVPGVLDVSRMVYGRASVAFRDKEISTTVVGADANLFTLFSDFYQINKGRIFTDSETRSVVLGYDAANAIFGKDKLDAGSVMQINGQNYRVVGVMAKIESEFAAHDNSMIFVPFDTGRDLFRTQLAKDEVTFMYLKIDPGYSPSAIKDGIERKIAANHRVTLDNKDFSVITSEFIQQTVGSILGLLSGLLLAITAVATLVGGIGIANTMFMSVLERFREIGILKSIGATDNDVRMIFLAESALIGFLGGLIGFVIAVAILFVAGQFGVPYLIRIRWIIFVFVFSAGVGIIAGYLPARQASRLDPVRALGYF
jgi:putative ABC transport system permease protein